MKTKIIYISGSEIFDMQDIRNAFDSVRNALGLGMDTVLFGVPVDNADALDADTTQSVSVAQSVATVDASELIPEAAQPIINTTPIAAVDTPVMETASAASEISEPVAVEPQKKTRGHPKSVKKVESTSELVISDAEPDTAKVVSILSVLTAKQDDAPATSNTPAPVDIPITTDAQEIDVIDDAPADDEIEPIDITAPISDELPVIDDIDGVVPDDAPQAVSIDDMITNDTPVVPQEKTLEQLLESMTPLREDIEHEQHIDAVNAAESFDTNATDDAPDEDMTDVSDDDATLEQLATEFAENQDKFETTTKPENHGKIGKLKNILPFKKARRDDSSLMGDLFGWAGIAANDEDFAIPGFFTNAASKK